MISRPEWRKTVRWVFWGGLVGFLFITWVLLVQPMVWVNKASHVPAVSPARLEAHVRMLSEALVPRDSEHPENLDKVALYIGGEFQKAGGRVREQRYSAHTKSYANVIAQFGPQKGPRIVLGAHYDAFEALPAADDNASGVAGLIELAYLLGQTPPSHCVELVAYSLEEPPYFSSDRMGSAIHASELRSTGVNVSFMASIEMIGTFSDAKGSQQPTNPLFRVLYPSEGNFIAVVGKFGDVGLIRRVKRGMLRGSALPVLSLNAPSFVYGIDLSDHLNYWKEGFPAVMITDTAFLRNDNYHTTQDTAEKLDYGRMAMVVQDLFTLVDNNQ